MSRKILLCLIVALLICVPTFFWVENRNNISQDELMQKIKSGYSQQFCNVIFPHIASCVTLKASECMSFAENVVSSCLADMQSNLESSYSKAAAQEVYQKVGTCYERDLHDILMQKYVIADESCWEKMK